MNKYGIFLTLFVFTLNCFSQTNLSTNGLTGSSYAATSLFSGSKVVDYGRGDSKNNVNIEGSPYLFENWNNKSKIWYGDTVFNLDSINYNVKDERFEIKLNKDSIFIISPDNDIKKVEIGIFEFKPYHNNELNANEFYGVLWEDANYSILSKYSLVIKGGSIDPLTKSYITEKEYAKEKNYFVLIHKENEEMIALKLKKSYVLKLIDGAYIDEIKTFVKNQKLKYHDINDVQKILTYYYSHKS